MKLHKHRVLLYHKHCIEIIDNARSSGWERQVEMNEKVLENLEKIITSLEKEHE